jgi:hypothetical protein
VLRREKFNSLERNWSKYYKEGFWWDILTRPVPKILKLLEKRRRYPRVSQAD